jgi:hypothetical protein
LLKGMSPFFVAGTALGLSRLEVFDLVIQHSHTQDMLMHSGSLGLAHHLLDVVPLPFGRISSEDHELMQLKTVSESSPQRWMPSCSHLTIFTPAHESRS